ncbi:MAG: hypothetical protein ACLT0Y_03915 [Christensenellales bacterium]
MKGKIVTNDFNLNKVATVKGVEVLNINELASSMKPAVMRARTFCCRLCAKGQNRARAWPIWKTAMVVVDSGASYIGSTASLYVTSVLQTAAGRMVFAKANE